jgi:putative ATP-dependent endonuclease of the OLD family
MADNIEIFYEPDNSKNTFEICLYELNKEICDDLFGVGRKTLSVQGYMLKNKAECAFALLDKKSEGLNHPDYINQAIQWIKE